MKATLNLGLFMILTAAGANAEIVFSNITTLGAVNSGPQISTTQGFAAAFTPSGSYTLTAADAVLFNLSGNQVGFSIYSNNSGVPGTSLDSLGQVTAGTNATALYTANTPATPLTLQDGVEYWLVLTGISGTSAWGNGGSPEAPPATFAGGSWAAAPKIAPFAVQFEVEGTAAATPEPGSATLLGLGLGAIATFWMRSRRD